MHLPTSPDLEGLLEALRLAGLSIGGRERLRLLHLFRLQHTLTAEGDSLQQVGNLLRTALAHSPEEGQIFDRVFTLWSSRWQAWIELEPATGTDGSEWDDVEVLRKQEELRNYDRRQKKAVEARVRARLVAIALIALSTQGAKAPEQAASRGPELPPGIESATSAIEIRPESNLARPTNEVTIPLFREVGEQKGFGLDPTRLAVAAVLLLLTLGALRFSVRKSAPPAIRPPTERSGPRRLPLLPQPPRGPCLLDRRAIRALVWGVDRYVTEKPSRNIDVPATALASAEKGGLPYLCFERQKQLREVWLWVDNSASEETMARTWASEIAEQLHQAGLPARVAHFDGVPDVLSWAESSHFFHASGIEAHRQTALVAIFTDGRVLRARAADARGLSTFETLRALGKWPRLTLVDLSAGNELSKALPDLPLPCVSPEDLPAFFCVGDEKKYSDRPGLDQADLRVWQAALALGGRACDRETAWALGRELRLAADPRAAGLLGELRWGAEERMDLLRWLALEGRTVDGRGIRRGSALEGALYYWKRRLDRETTRRGERELLDRWRGSPAERFLEMEKAVLDLWDNPTKATRRLLELRDADLDPWIQKRLGALAPAEAAGNELVPLPWRLDELDGTTKAWMLELGLGGLEKPTVMPSGRRRLGFVILAVLIGALTIRGSLLTATDRRPLVTSEIPERARIFSKWNDSSWQLVAISPDGKRHARNDVGGKSIEVDWAVIATEREPAFSERVDTLAFVRLMGGIYRMGSPVGAPGSNENERPAHHVSIDDFWMTPTEITNEQYRRRAPAHPGANDLPAVGVTWSKARAFCRSLGNGDDGWFYDLPTEAEWEYATRAGTGTPWHFGDDERLLEFYAWHSGNSNATLHPVATKAPNPWGLYDLYGNASEWVLDCSETYPEDAVAGDPALVEGSCHQGGPRFENRVLRGGSFEDGAASLRSSSRNWRAPEVKTRTFGFRCVRRSTRA